MNRNNLQESLAKKRFKILKKAYKKEGISCKKYSKKEINEAIKKWGSLPKVLIEYYETIGLIEGDMDHPYHIFYPEDLYIYEDGVNTKKKYLVFASEMQGVETLSFALEDLNKENPVLYVLGPMGENLTKYSDYLYVSGNRIDEEYGDNYATSLINFVFNIASLFLGEEFEFEEDKLDENAAKERKRKLEEKAKLRDLISKQRKLAQEIVHGKRDTSEITDLMIEHVTELDCDNRGYRDSKPISDISILSKFKNLKILKLEYNEIKDLSPLKDLVNLTKLDLNNNQIEDISPLKNLKNLKVLFLSQNRIKNISALSGLTKLTSLTISNNKIENIEPIKELLKLNYLILINNKITDISALANLTMLENLELDNNNIVDISPVKNLKKLKILTFENNQVSDISMLSGLINMYNLTADNNPIKDANVVSHMKNLQLFYFKGTRISDIKALTKLSKITTVKISNTQVTDLSPLKDLTNVSTIDISNTRVTRIAAIKDFKNLEKIDLRGTHLEDIGAIPFDVEIYFPEDGFTEKTYRTKWNERQYLKLFITGKLDISQLDTYLQKRFNEIEEVKIEPNDIHNKEDLHILKYCTNLKILQLDNIKGIDLNIIKDLKQLIFLSLSNTEIKDITPLKNLDKLEFLILKNNQIKDLTPLAKLNNLTALNISGNNIEDITPILSLKLKHLNIADNKLSEEVVKKETKLTISSISFENSKVVPTYRKK